MTLDRHYVIFGAIAALSSWLLITHLIPSSRWLPYAFLAGLLFSFGCFLYLAFARVRPWSDDDATPDNGSTFPAFLTAEQWEKEKAALKQRAVYEWQPVYFSSLKVSNAFDEVLRLLLDDHVSAWFGKISPQPQFRHEIDKAIRSTLLSLGQITQNIDLVETVVLRLVPIFTNHMQAFYIAERLVRGKNLTRDVTISDEVDLAVATKYRDGNMHKAVSLTATTTAELQQAHIRKIIGAILPRVLPANMLTSSAVMTLIREIVSCAVLTPVLTMLEDPDTWNQLLETFGRTLLHDRKTVRKLRAALDEHASRSSRTSSLPVLKPHDSERHFERFIRSLRSTPSVSTARRFRNELAAQISRLHATDHDDPIFIRRLQTGKRILDQRIEDLVKEGARSPSNGRKRSESILYKKLQSSPLRDVLHSPSGLSYFMEFMDRRDKMRFVQFWITIDGFRNPLEDDNDDADFTFQEKATYVSADRLDIAQIKVTYLDGPGIDLPYPDQVILDRYMTDGSDADMHMYLSARRVILRAQTAAYEDMRDNDFDAFKQSDLFHKWLAMEESTLSHAAPAMDATQLPQSPLAALHTDLGRNQHTSGTDSPRRPRSAIMRRAAASSVDLPTSAAKLRLETESRRSVDDMSARPLFNDDVEVEGITQSTRSLVSAGSDVAHDNQVQPPVETVDVIQKELDQIMDQAGSDDGSPELFFKATPQLQHSLFGEDADQRSAVSTSRPNLKSLGLITGRSFSGVFADDLFTDEQQQFLEDEKDVPENSNMPELEIKEAAPGDLGLSEAILALKAQIDRLVQHDQIIDSLTKKAELTNNAAELRILRKSKHSLRREIERAEMQKQQYVIQESDNSLYGKASVTIKSIMVGREDDGHEYAIYVIEVRRQAGDSLPAVSWSVTRRYSEFHELHKRLRAKFASVKSMEFPRRQTLFSLQKEFLRKRRMLLENYLQELLCSPTICRSRELRAFLSQSAITNASPLRDKASQGDFVTRIYNSVSDGMDELLGNISALDQLTAAGHNLISAASSQLLDTRTALHTEPGPTGIPANQAGMDTTSAKEAEAEIEAFENRDATPFVKPISDLFVETFELQKGSSWLRGRAVVVVLHQLLGGTVERKIREAARLLTTEAALTDYLLKFKEILRPNGMPRPPTKVRTSAEKAQSKKEAELVLATLIPDMASGVVGKANAQAASRKISAMLNNERLNAHLVLTLLDEVVSIILPDLFK